MMHFDAMEVKALKSAALGRAEAIAPRGEALAGLLRDNLCPLEFWSDPAEEQPR